jgi:hypothetical protein
MTRAELISFRVDANQVYIAKYASAADGAKWSLTDNARPHLEEHEEIKGGPDHLPPAPLQKGGIHGLHVIAIFLACGFLMTIGCRGMTVILVLSWA